MLGKKKNKYKNQNGWSYKAPILGVMCAALLGGGVYIGKHISKQDVDKQEKTIDKEYTHENLKHILRKGITYESEGVFLDDILKFMEEEKEPFEPAKKKDKIDYSAIKGLDCGLQEKVKKTLEEDILSEKWITKRYEKMFTRLSKFDDMFVDSRNYALLVQELGPSLLNNNRLQKSRTGASGYGQLMPGSKIENGLISNGIIDESYHPIKGIKAAMQHHKRYNFENILPKLNEKISLDLAVYNFGYGNVMNGIAKIIEEKGKDPEEIFRYSNHNTVLGIKNAEKLDNLDIDYEKFSKKIPLETRNYIERVNALTVFMDNVKQGNLEGVKIKKQPLFSELFEERRLGEGNYLYKVWEDEVKDKGVSWDIYNNMVNMHIVDNTKLTPDTKILVPSKKMPVDYF